MKSFIRDTLLASLLMLPVALVVMIYGFLAKHVAQIIEPIKNMLPSPFAQSDLAGIAVSIFMVILALFLIGLLLRTTVGGRLHDFLESKILKILPFYTFITESIRPFLPGENKDSPFKTVVLIKPYGCSTAVIALVADELDINQERHYACFIPSGVLPPAGQTLLIKAKNAQILKGVKVDDALKLVLTCGVGTSRLFERHIESDLSPKNSTMKK